MSAFTHVHIIAQTLLFVNSDHSRRLYHEMNKIAEKLLKNHVEKPVELSQTEVTVQKKTLVADLSLLGGRYRIRTYHLHNVNVAL